MKKERNIFMSIKLIVLIIVVAAVLFLIYNLYCGYSIYKSSAQRSTNERTSDMVLINWLTDDKGFDFYDFTDTYTIEEISITSKYGGHSIPASYIYAKGRVDKNAPTAIMVHGLLGNRLSNYPMSQMFLDLGYNVITYDQRSSGGNTAPYTTYGFMESYDVIDYVNYAREQMGDDDKLVVWGQSLGAATISNAMDTAVFSNNVDYVILDSPLGNAEDMMTRPTASGKLRIFFADIFNKAKIGYTFKEQRVYPQIENTPLPVMVACSKGDSSIPYELEERVYNTIKNNKKVLYTVEDSDHSDIYFDHPEEYSKKIAEFISEP